MSAGSHQRFVYAVCGPEPHIRTLNRSIELLKRHSTKGIVVITDHHRNSAKIEHGEVVSVETPPRLDDRQAAIYLKTRLHRILEPDRVYCYLDSDVMAVSRRVDEIFDHYRPPVTFASDLPSPVSNLKRFSRYGLDCPCGPRYQKLNRYFELLERFNAEHDRNVDFEAFADPGFYQGAVFRGRKRRGRWWTGQGTGCRTDGSPKYVQEFRHGKQVRITYFFADNPWRWVKEQRYEPAGLWRDDDGHTFRWIAEAVCVPGGYWLDEHGDSYRLIRHSDDSQSGYWYQGDDRRYQRCSKEDGSDNENAGEGWWIDHRGDVVPLECDHLAEALERQFGVEISDRRWVNWNGGVFLFGPESTLVLDDWHVFAMRLITTAGWKVRDQAALIAAAWKHGLEHHPRLPRELNRIVDRRAESTEGWRRATRQVRSGDARLLHFINGGAGDRSWSVWREIEDLLGP